MISLSHLAKGIKILFLKFPATGEVEGQKLCTRRNKVSTLIFICDICLLCTLDMSIEQ